MKKFLNLILLILLACILAGLYGIIHDQFTYTISPEYYTKFKFLQFGIVDDSVKEGVLEHPRRSVAVVGFFASWWMGIPIGLVLGLVGLMHNDARKMFKVTHDALYITLIVAFVTGLVGLLIGMFYLAPKGVDWWMPGDLVNRENFIAVGSMHNFSYAGGVVGMIVGIVYSMRHKQAETRPVMVKNPSKKKA